MKDRPAGKRTSGPPKRILVLDDHPMTRHGVTQRLNLEPGFVVCGEVGTAKAALAAVQTDPPDLVLVDLTLGDRSGLDLLKDLHALYPTLPLLVFSMHYETLYAERVLRAGGRGYIMKSEGAAKLVDAIRRVLRGEIYLSEGMRDRALKRFAGRPAEASPGNMGILSDRELEIFGLIGQGIGTREIARHLNVAMSTVETHRAHLKEKLNLRTASELVRAAVEWAGRESRGYGEHR
ncbi:MAG: response regulator transcription factor [Opitutaceae bacterium]